MRLNLLTVNLNYIKISSNKLKHDINMSSSSLSGHSSPEVRQELQSNAQTNAVQISRRNFSELFLLEAAVAIVSAGCVITQIPKSKPDTVKLQPSDDEISGIMSKLIRRIEAGLKEEQKENALINCASEDDKDANGKDVPDAVLKAKAKAEAINNEVAGKKTKSIDIEIEDAGTKKIVCVQGERNTDEVDWEKERMNWIEFYSRLLKWIEKFYNEYKKTQKNWQENKKIYLWLTKKISEKLFLYKNIISEKSWPLIDLEGKKMDEKAKEIATQIFEEAVERSKSTGYPLTDTERVRAEDVIIKIMDDMKRAHRRLRNKVK